MVESVRGVMWARRRQPDDVVYGVALGHERFGPGELLEQAVAAERAAFDLVCCSDHLPPWWDPAEGVPAHCGNAGVWLGAVGNATSEVAIGPAVSAIVHRYNPVVMAQQAATLDLLTPGGRSWPRPPTATMRRWNPRGSGRAPSWMRTTPTTFTIPPRGLGALGRNVSDRTFKTMGILSADPATHVRKIKAMRALGATAIVVMNVSGADPIGTLHLYGEEVLPALRDGSS